MRTNKFYERVAIAFTISRLLFPAMVTYLLLASDLATRNLLAALAVILFVVADIFDGAYARNKGIDTIKRRLTDGIVDKVSVHVCYIATVISFDVSIWWYVPMLLRDMLHALVVWLMYARKNIKVYPNWLLRGANIVLAGGEILILLGMPYVQILLGGLHLVIYLTLFEYIGIYLGTPYQKEHSFISTPIFTGWKYLMRFTKISQPN